MRFWRLSLLSSGEWSRNYPDIINGRLFSYIYYFRITEEY